jgi:hypothetical protein
MSVLSVCILFAFLWQDSGKNAVLAKHPALLYLLTYFLITCFCSYAVSHTNSVTGNCGRTMRDRSQEQGTVDLVIKDSGLYGKAVLKRSALENALESSCHSKVGCSGQGSALT